MKAGVLFRWFDFLCLLFKPMIRCTGAATRTVHWAAMKQDEDEAGLMMILADPAAHYCMMS